MPTMKIGLEVISSRVCCSAPNGDLRIQISIHFCQFCFRTLCNCQIVSMSFCIKLNVSIDVNFAKFSISIGGDPVVNAKARMTWIWILTMRRWCSSAWREGTGHQSGPRQVSNMGTSQICDRKFQQWSTLNRRIFWAREIKKICYILNISSIHQC